MTKPLHALLPFWGHPSELPMGQRAHISISLRTSRPLGLPYQRGGANRHPLLGSSGSQAPVSVWVPFHPGCILLLLGLTQVLSYGVVQACES